MSDYLHHDKKCMDVILHSTVKIALEFLSGINNRAAGVTQPSKFATLPINHDGMGIEEAIVLFKKRYEPWISGSAGPRYFGFIIGGVTPAALVGNWRTTEEDMVTAWEAMQQCITA